MSLTTSYNFVPLSEETYLPEDQAAIDHRRYHTGRHTGWLEVSYTAQTPFYIRAAAKTKNVMPGATDFFNRGTRNSPVVPGDEIRGMICSVFEIVTKSRLRFTNDFQLYFRTFAESITGMQREYLSVRKEENIIAGTLKSLHGIKYLVSFPEDSKNYGYARVRHDSSIWPDLNFNLCRYFEGKCHVQANNDIKSDHLDANIASEKPDSGLVLDVRQRRQDRTFDERIANART